METPLSPLEFARRTRRLHADREAVLREGSSATEEEIIAFARERLAHFKAPRGVTFVAELPKTATGKIQKFVLRKGAPNLSQQ